jgi:hypothetical protein
MLVRKKRGLLVSLLVILGISLLVVLVVRSYLPKRQMQIPEFKVIDSDSSEIVIRGAGRVTDQSEAVEVRWILIEERTTKSQLSRLLTSYCEDLKKKTGYQYQNHPTKIEIFAYVSETWYKQDEDWWIGRLLWRWPKGNELSFNFDHAKISPNRARGLTEIPSEEYMTKMEGLAERLELTMDESIDLWKDYVKGTLSQSEFLNKLKLLIEEIDRVAQEENELPYPAREMVSLDKHFRRLVASASDFTEFFVLLRPARDRVGLFNINTAFVNEAISQWNKKLKAYKLDVEKWKNERRSLS